MKINNKGYAITLIVFGILIVFIVVLSTLLITMNNSVKLNKTVKESVVESIQLGEDTSGSSFIDRIEALEEQMNNIKSEIYPIGSIYMSAEDDTIEKVQERFGGTWEVYAQGRTLVGVGTGTDKNGNAQIFTNNSEGGEYIHTLTTNEMPSHSHSIPSLSGTASSTGNGYTLGHTCETRTTSSSGNHNHRIRIGFNQSGYGYTIPERTIYLIWSTGVKWTDTAISGQNYTSWYSDNNGSHTHTYPDCYLSSLSGVAAHTHGVTTNTGNTGSQGLGSSFSMQNPYITVYMYKRIK